MPKKINDTTNLCYCHEEPLIDARDAYLPRDTEEFSIFIRKKGMCFCGVCSKWLFLTISIRKCYCFVIDHIKEPLKVNSHLYHACALLSPLLSPHLALYIITIRYRVNRAPKKIRTRLQ